MPASALALVLVAGLIHASWNVAAKKAGGDARFAAFTGTVMMLFWAPLGVWLGIDELPRWGSREWLVVAGSAVLHTLYYLTLLRGYRRADLTVVYPLARGSAPLLSSVAAVFLLGEHLTPQALAGILAIVGGVFLIAGGTALLRPAADPQARLRLHRGLRYGTLTGVFIAGYTVIDGYAVKLLAVSPILLDYIGNLMRLAMVGPPLLRDRAAIASAWRLQWKHAIFVGIVSPVSYVLVLYAVKVAPLSHVAPAREVSMLFAALLGGHLLGEGDRRARLTGAACIAAGVAALGLGA